MHDLKFDMKLNGPPYLCHIFIITSGSPDGDIAFLVGWFFFNSFFFFFFCSFFLLFRSFFFLYFIGFF